MPRRKVSQACQRDGDHHTNPEQRADGAESRNTEKAPVCPKAWPKRLCQEGAEEQSRGDAGVGIEAIWELQVTHHRNVFPEEHRPVGLEPKQNDEEDGGKPEQTIGYRTSQKNPPDC